MKRGEALSWVLVETAPPSVPKRGKAARSESVEIEISDDANVVLQKVVSSNESTVSVVAEAYLNREYR